ncbi:hypothetical protein FEM03_01735 [Phragmitibacter flavus]|uniref:Uncharacterized protein n=1 Tax=Phragmitibacter flavus TaxID=2576071 RepID=A0A5R8KKG3_9BACT|nr:hypothetical protein [Phragmitibacter flavus]TLD72818.1 hypothetical protein FEM03_01735 [Phragmitibacter flavus]
MPYEDLEKVFNDGGKGVFLPYKEFLELWGELNLKRVTEEVKPPQDGVVSRAEYRARRDGETLVIDAVVTVESFKKGWLSLPLTRGNTPMGLAEADTGEAILKAGAEGYDVLLPDKGRYELKLKMYAAVKRVAGKQGVTLVLPKATVSRFDMLVPGNGWAFEVNPAAAYTAREEGADTQLAFFVGSGGKFDIHWQKRDAETALAPLILVSNQIKAEVQAGSLVTKSELDLRILRAAVPNVVLTVPAGQQVMSVAGAGLKDWNLETAGEGQRLTLTPNEPVKDAWKINLVLEAALPNLPGELVVPEIGVEGAAQQRGEIGVLAEGHLDVTPKAAEGMVQQTQTGGEESALTAVGGYRFLKLPAKLTLSVAEAKAQVDVDSVTLLTVNRESMKLESRFQYAIRRVGIFESRMNLPSGWSGWEVMGMKADRWAVEGSTLVVKFDKQMLGEVAFTLRAQAVRGGATEEVAVPVLVPLEVTRHDAKVGVAVQTSLEVSTKLLGDLRQDDVSSLDIAAPRSMNGDPFGGPPGLIPSPQKVEASGLSVSTGTELTLAFRYRDEIKTAGTLGFKAREPQVNVEVLTLVEAREQSLRHSWTLAFDVAYAGTDRFVLAVPKSVEGDIRFVDPGVKEIDKNYQASEAMKKELPGAEGFAFWEVILRSERMNQFSLSLSVEKPLPAESGKALEFLAVHVPGSFQETAQVAVVKEDALEIRDYKVENLEEIDPAELHRQISRPGVLLAFKSRSQAVKLALEVTRNAYIAVPQAVVTHAILTSAVATDGAQTTEMIYWVRNNAQQFLAVELPKGARLVSDVFVDGTTQQPMKREGSDDLLVRLPAGAGSTSRSLPVRLVYEMPSVKPGEKMGMSGTFTILPPKLANVGVVMESHAQLFLPERQDYTGFESAMTQSLRDRGWGRVRRVLDSLIPSFGPQLIQPSDAWQPAPAISEQQKAAFDFRVPTQGQDFKLHRLGAPDAIEVGFRSRKLSYFYEGVMFLVVLLSGVALIKSPLQRKVVFVCVGGVVAVLLTGMVGAANGAVVQAGLLGLLAVTGLWLALGVPVMFRALAGSGMAAVVVTGGFLFLGLAWMIALASREPSLVGIVGVLTLLMGGLAFLWLLVRWSRSSRTQAAGVVVASAPMVESKEEASKEVK